MKYFNNYNKIFFLLILYFTLYLISSSYMNSRHEQSIFLLSYDSDRYIGLENFFDGGGQKAAWHLFFTYTVFITFLEKINLINYYVEAQYLIFYISSILFYKSLLRFNFTQISSILSTLFIVCNPFIIFWIHTINHAGLTISLVMTTFYFLARYDDAKIFKIFFFIFIFLLLKVDGKVFFTGSMILFYKFYLYDGKKSLTNLFIIIFFFVSYLFYLNYFAMGLEPFSSSYLQYQVLDNSFIYPTINNEVIETFNKCSIDESNSLQNHFCALIDNPIYSLKLYSARFFLALTWINSNLSLKYNLFAFGMISFLYFGLLINLLNTKFTTLKFFLISTYLLTIVIVLPYFLRGDQKQVFYGIIFIVPLCFSGIEILLKYLKTKWIKP